MKEYKETCPCGGCYNSKSSYYKHIKTKTHIEFIDINKDNADIMKTVRNEFLAGNICLLEGEPSGARDAPIGCTSEPKKTTNKKVEDNRVTVYYENENGTKKILKLTKEHNKCFIKEYI